MDQYSQDYLCGVFHALGDPTRMAMLRQIGLGEAAAGDLAKPRGITLTATLKHLRVLEEAGLVVSVKVGRERRCRMREGSLDDIERWVSETRRLWTLRLDALDEFLRQPEEKP